MDLSYAAMTFEPVLASFSIYHGQTNDNLYDSSDWLFWIDGIIHVSLALRYGS